MSLVQEAGSTAIAQFAVPLNGTQRSTAIHLVSSDALFDSLNVFIRKGKLRSRPGLVLLNETVFNAPITGGAMAVTPTEKILLAINRFALYTLTASDAEWQLDTTANFSFTDNDTIDTCFLETSNEYVCIIANENFPLKYWKQGSGAAAIFPSVGVVPTAKSVCTATRRIVALIDPHTIQWSATLDYTNWPPLAVTKIAQTNDTGICVRSLGTLDFVIYKERSVYVAKAQAGSDSNAFNIRFLQHIEGPAGVNAVVNANDVHYYMTKNGRIASFDGNSYIEWIADGLWLYLQDDIDPRYAAKIFGVFDFRLHTVTFYYPKVTDTNGLMTGMVVICLPLRGLDVQQTSQVGISVKKKDAAFLGISRKPCCFGYEMRFKEQIDRSLIFTSVFEDCQSFYSSEDAADDDGLVYDSHIQTGCFPMPELKHSNVSIEPFFERQDGYGKVNVNAVTLDSLENETGTISDEAQIIDLNSNPVREYIGFNIPTRFFGLKYTWTSVDKIRYAGSSVYGRTLS
jgi:hypothetical protein